MKSFKSLTLVYFCSKLGILYKLCRSSSHTYFSPTFGPLRPSTNNRPPKSRPYVLRAWNDLKAINAALHHLRRNAPIPPHIACRKTLLGHGDIPSLLNLKAKIRSQLNSKSRKQVYATRRLFTKRRSSFFASGKLGAFLTSALNRASTFRGIEGIIDAASGAVSRDPTATMALATHRISTTFFKPRIPTPAHVIHPMEKNLDDVSKTSSNPFDYSKGPPQEFSNDSNGGNSSHSDLTMSKSPLTKTRIQIPSRHKEMQWFQTKNLFLNLGIQRTQKKADMDLPGETSKSQPGHSASNIGSEPSTDITHDDNLGIQQLEKIPNQEILLSTMGHFQKQSGNNNTAHSNTTNGTNPAEMNITLARLSSNLDNNILQTSNIYVLQSWGKDTHCQHRRNWDEITFTCNKHYAGAKSSRNSHTDELMRQWHSLPLTICRRTTRDCTPHQIYQENTSKNPSATWKIWDSAPNSCSQPDFSNQNLDTHATNIFQDTVLEKINNRIEELTWKTQSALSRQKTAAQVAQTVNKHCKLVEYHQHMILRLYNHQITKTNLPNAIENTKPQGMPSAPRKIWDLTPDHCSQPENPYQNPGSHLTHISQDSGGEKPTNTMNKPTWKIHGTLSQRKTAAQVALIEIKQYKSQGNHQHMILNACNQQIILKNMRHAIVNTTTQGTTVDQPNNEATEGVSPTSYAKLTWGKITEVRKIETTNKISQYLGIRISGKQNSLPGTKPRSTKIVNKILHDEVTDRIRLWGNNETPDPQSQSNDKKSKPTIHERRPVNIEITKTGVMADEGTPSKKPRHEEIAQSNEQAVGTGTNLKESAARNTNLALSESSPLNGAQSPSHGKKRSANELNASEKLIPVTGSPSSQKEEQGEDNTYVHSDDEYIPPMELNENTPLPPECPTVPSERTIRLLTAVQEQGSAFKLGDADLASALKLIPGMQILFAAYEAARGNILVQSHTLIPFAQGADSFVGDFNNASAIPDRELRMAKIDSIINDIARAIAHEDAAIAALDSRQCLLKALQDAILTLGTHQDAFQQVVEKQGALAVATVMCHRAHLRKQIKERYRAKIARVIESIDDDIARNTRWIQTFSSSLPDDIQTVERHWGTHMCLRATMQLSIDAFQSTSLSLSMNPGRSSYSMKRASLYEENWAMATAESMTAARITAASKAPKQCLIGLPVFPSQRTLEGLGASCGILLVGSHTE